MAGQQFKVCKDQKSVRSPFTGKKEGKKVTFGQCNSFGLMDSNVTVAPRL